MLNLLAILGVYYIAHTAAIEDGPFGLCAAIREKIDPEGKQDTWLRRGVNCPICISCYVAFLATFFLPYDSFVITWFGLAGGATVIHLWVSK